VEKLVQGYDEDEMARQLLAELSVCSPNSAGYALTEGVIRYKGRVWVGNNQLAQQHIIQSLHSSGIGGHSGFLANE
jgi:hypothetical protein